MIYLRLFRVKNLLIVALTQFLLQFLVVLPYLKTIEREPILDVFHFSLLVFVTILIAASGYVINDYYDVEIDSVNKPEKLIVGKLISKENALKIYSSLVVFGGIISIFLAVWVENLKWVIIYPFAILLLWGYARYFKKMSIVGNLVVAAFSSGVAGIVLFPEIFSHEFSDTNRQTVYMLAVFSGYIFFAFCSTMYREIVKDLEDMDGDKAFGAQTLPVVSGVKISKIFASVWGGLLALIFGILTGFLFYLGNNLIAAFGLFLVLVPLIFSFWKLVKASSSSQFHFISQMIKVVMFGGLIFLIFLVKTF